VSRLGGDVIAHTDKTVREFSSAVGSSAYDKKEADLKSQMWYCALSRARYSLERQIQQKRLRFVKKKKKEKTRFYYPYEKVFFVKEHVFIKTDTA